MSQLIAKYPKRIDVQQDVDSMESLMMLSNYLNEHVENDLAPALLDKAVSIVQSAVSIPESFIVNEEDGKQLNVESIDLDEK